MDLRLVFKAYGTRDNKSKLMKIYDQIRVFMLSLYMGPKKVDLNLAHFKYGFSSHCGHLHFENISEFYKIDFI